MSLVRRWILVSAVSHWSGLAAAGTQLPVPCAPGFCATTNGFVTSGAATAVQAGKTLDIHQTSSTATLNWASFNVSADGKVIFQQPSANAVALNRIYDANPSSIFGTLTANGQIYLINANGFLFGSTARVDVAGLIASSLNITDSTFESGILAPVDSFKPALEQFTVSSQNFASDGPLGAQKITNVGTISVQDGARLTAADGGRLLLAAPTVQNAGALSASDGQIVLAAGQNIYLQASSDTSLRGLIVQVDSGTAAAGEVMGVVNQSTGTLSAPRGNITLAGLMVNQDGRISATTSVSANGSVTLEAAEKPNFNSTPMSASIGGTLTIGSDSIIDVLPELSDTTTAVAAQVQLPSTITLTGEQVIMQGGSIQAPGGVLNVTALANPGAGLQYGVRDPNARIRIDSGTNIDLSGSDAILPMAANLVTVQLRSNEFADDPTQRNGALRGDTVTVDIRADGGAGTPIADLSSAIAAVGETIAQRTEAGGKASFVSDGDVVFGAGASISVSGGQTTYLGGNLQTTQLVGANGQIYDIGSASPLMTYTGLINPTFTQTYNKWGVQEIVPTPGLSHYESTYSQGAGAGSVQFTAPSMALDGTLQASAVYGPYQRGAPLGGTLIIGSGGIVNPTPPGATLQQFDYFAPSIEVVTVPIPIVVADTASLPPQTLQLPAAYLTTDGFTSTQIYSNAAVALPAKLPLQLPAGSSLAVQASRIDIDSTIIDLGGSLSLENELTLADQNTTGAATLGPVRLGIGIGNGVAFDVSGLWTNDSLLAGGLGSGPTLQNAGAINLQLTTQGSQLVLGNDVTLRANGGAWEQTNGSLTYGRGGSVTLDASPAQSALQFGSSLTAEAFGAYTASGGSFSLLAPRIEISQGSGSSWTVAQRVDDLNAQGQVLALYAPLFSDYGFSSITLTATGGIESTATNDVLTVEGSTVGKSGTTIIAQTHSLELDPGYQIRPTGGTLAGHSQVVMLPAYLRPATNVSLNVLRELDDVALGSSGYGSLDLQPGASILAGPGAAISLAGEGNIAIGGTLRAPGGTVSVELVSTGLLYNSNVVSIFDPGYIADLGISLAPSAVIDVSGGNAVLTPSNQGLLVGTLRAGGSINIDAQRGNLIIDKGALIDISGSSATLDIANPQDGGYAREVVASAGGSLTLGSVESIELLGRIEGFAGAGGSAAGSLEIDLARSGDVIFGQPNPTQPLQIDLSNSTSATAPGLDVASIGLATIEASGIDALTLDAGGTASGIISISTAHFSLGRSLILESQSLSVTAGTEAALAAPYVVIGNPFTLTVPGITTPPTPTTGTGSLTVTASQLSLVGNVSLEGIGSLTLRSQGDVQLGGTLPLTQAGMEAGSLLSAGNITIEAARVYPDTFTSFTIAAQEDGGATSGAGASSRVEIDQFPMGGRAAPSPGAPLSGDGVLNVLADDIEIGGRLYAPFGQIALEANKSLTLSAGSLVSVSGAGLEVPFGQTQEDGAQWLYVSQGSASITGTPTKQVSLTSPTITLQPGAAVDLRGGGDLYAYEWVPGTGGTTDSLAGSGPSRVPGLYAILPDERGQAAPFDPQESPGFNPAQTVYLGGGAGVTSGYYALLPPRYALVPGALLIEVEPGYSSAVAGQIGSLADGIPVIAGYLSSMGTTLHTGSTEYEGFAVYPGSYGQQLATYNLSYASSYFSAAAALAATGPVPEPADAGTLTFNVVLASNSLLDNSLDLQGTVDSAAANGGRGALINLSAPNLVVNSSGANSIAGTVAVSGTLLQSWNASALTLGGVASSDNTNVTVTAGSVSVDQGVNLTADQIIIVAQQSIDVKGFLSSTPAKDGALLAAPAATSLTLSDSSAALVAVSDLALPIVARSAGGAGATITLEPGSSLNSGGALVLDAPGSVVLDGSLGGKGASWSLGSSSIAFVGAGPSPDTLNIDSSVLAALQTASSVRLASQGTIDLYAPVSLGGRSGSGVPTLSSLTLLGSEINSETGSDSTFAAASLTLGGVTAPSSGGAPITPVSGAGTLHLVANTLDLAPNAVAVSGFADTLVQAAGGVTSSITAPGIGTASGNAATSSASSTTAAGGFNVAGNLTINAVELTPGAGSQTTIDASGTLAIGTPTVLAKGTTLTTLIGGELNVSASSIVDNGSIAAPSGIVSLSATGGDLELGRTGTIDVSGTLLQAVNRQAPSPGGMVTLSATGNLSLDAGSKVNVAGKGVAPAGTLSIDGGVGATNTVTLAGTVVGAAGSGGTGGSFSVDASNLVGGLEPLASSLVRGGFTDAINVRVRNGDLVLPVGATIDANSITLTADVGAVTISGVLQATSAAQRGSIDLNGGTTVTIDSAGQLHADGGASGLGGEIELNSSCLSCSISLARGSVITATGANQSGELILRAPATVDASGQADVAINVGSTGIGADVSQAGQVIIEPLLTPVQTTAGTVNSDLATAINAASAYLAAAAPVIGARLTTSSTTPLNVHAAVELQDTNSTDTLTLSGLVDLSTYSDPAYYGSTLAPQVIDLTVRAAGSINFTGTISDGFITDPTGNSSLMALSNQPSASFMFVAGADTASANPSSVLRGSMANLTLASSPTPADGSTDGVGPSVVRTGTGDINLVAANDVVFASGPGGAAAVYTAGLAPANVLGPVSYDNGVLIANFGTGGGNLRVSAGANVIGAPVGGTYTQTDGENYGVGGWQLHQGNNANQSEYGIDYGAFDWNVGALGGGDVTVRAGGSVTNLSAAAADSLVAADNTANNTSTTYGAGGGLSITAGGDIGSPQIFVADGVGTLIAGGGLTPTLSFVKLGTNVSVPVGAAIALDNSQLAVWARNAVQVDAIYDPTYLSQVNDRFDPTLLGGYLTYGSGSGVSLSSTSGAVTVELISGPGPSQALMGQSEISLVGASLLTAPPSMTLQALQNSILFNGGLNLAPSPSGQLSLFAAEDLTGTGATLSNNQIVMSDASLANIPTAANPALNGKVIIPFQGVIHSGDPYPALITAGEDIIDMTFSVPKAAEIVAGRDITNLGFTGQNVSGSDISLISAGRDLTSIGLGSGPGIQLSGPGSLDVMTGRNLNLGLGNGIVTLGSIVNPNLPTSAGADLSVMAGYGSEGADFTGFLSKIIAPSASYQAELIDFVESIDGGTSLSFGEAKTAFASLATSEQGALIDNIFFNELLLSGRAANSSAGTAGFQRGYDAIDALFPASRTSNSPYSGDLTLVSSQIYTDSGGNISILVPGGQVNVGLANPPPTIAQKPASSLGIVAEGAGSVSIYALNDVNVNKSRVFTLGGGNILIWSTLGSIDAGNGSKSSLSVPPPTVSINQQGVVALNFGASLASGSGIRTIQTSSDVPPGNVDLDAPVGTVNAGDAGIGASGDINIAAAHVIGVNNISFGGTASGVPAEVSNLGASLSGASAVAAGSTSSSTSSVTEANASKETAPLAQSALSWLDVFVTGLGEENCRQDDVECLKRQKAAAP
jgi:filamentous hemagglutinin family protein